MSARAVVGRGLVVGGLVLAACNGSPGVEATSTEASSTGVGTTGGTSTGDGTPTTSGPADSTDVSSGGPGPGTTTSAVTTGDTSGPSPDMGGGATTGDDSSTGAAVCPPPLDQPPGSWTSEIVQVGADDALQYIADADGNRIADFSYAGYHRAEAPIPEVPMAVMVAPIDGDNTEQIQAAIDEVGALPPGPDGLRGAVVLAPGTYSIAGSLLLRHSGVVLRGAGDGDDPAVDTILKAVGDTPHQRSVIIAGSGVDHRWKPELADTRRDIVTDKVQVGARQLEVEDAGPFAVGDHVVIVHPCTAEWIAAVDGGGTGTDEPWKVGQHPLVFKRQILAIDGAMLTIDAPVFNHLDRALAQSYVYKLDQKDTRTEIGVEDLRIAIVTKGGEDEDHAWTGVAMRGIEDGWVRRVTAINFGYAGVSVQTGSQLTISETRALDPVAIQTGERMYNFDVSGAQQVLFTRCEATDGRHHYVSNGTSWTSGVVFHRSTSTSANTPSEGHRRWSMGLLYDNIVESDFDTPGKVVLGLYNRGDYGTGHGWASAHSVAWNYDVGEGVGAIQKPPTAQNYAVGGVGVFSGEKPPAPFVQPEGYIEGSGVPGLVPESLYERQLEERLCGLR